MSAMKIYFHILLRKCGRHPKRKYLCLICMPLFVVLFISANIPCTDCRGRMEWVAHKNRTTPSVNDVRAIAYDQKDAITDDSAHLDNVYTATTDNQ